MQGKLVGDVCGQTVKSLFSMNFKVVWLCIVLFCFLYQNNLAGQPHVTKPHPIFGSHASYHITIKHHGEEAADGDDGLEDPCYPATLVFRSMADDFQVSSKIVIPDGIDLDEVEVWYFTLNESVMMFGLDILFESLGQALCLNVTSGVLKKLVFVSANFLVVNVLATISDTIVDFVKSDFDISLIPDSEDDAEEQHPGFRQLPAATLGLNRIGADQRDRTGSGTNIFILDTGVRTTHSEFGARAASGADVTSGSLMECKEQLIELLIIKGRELTALLQLEK